MMTFIRSALYAFWFYLTMVLFGLICLPVSLFSRGAAMSAIRMWAGAQRLGLRFICGIRTEFRGMEHLPKGAGLIAMKHQSTYDTIAPFLFIHNPGYILKRELLKLPIFGTYASRVGIPIDRAGGAKTMKLMLAAARKGAEAGQQIVIFPEGTRQLPDTPTDVKPGVIFMYKELDIPCVPVALNTGLCWQGSGFIRKPGHIVFEVLKPIEPGLKRAEFTQRLKDALDPATARLVVEGRAAQR
ncbi:MAG: 1-acyl-sn-glycerol-3-phosphate acyltransferase [Burkholderiales bacterium]|nr:MAG: 1-acyl-sn-glycerol-3-phosphate acyltransferase [Burkholderiales bacterium]